MASGALKKTTNITGLAVARNPHHTLGVLYSKILRALAKMPETAAYRKNTEQIIKERASIVQNTASVQDIEEKICCGQVNNMLLCYLEQYTFILHVFYTSIQRDKHSFVYIRDDQLVCS